MDIRQIRDRKKRVSIEILQTIIEAEKELIEESKIRDKIGNIIIDFYPPEDRCPICSRRLVELKTTIRNAKYIEYGKFVARRIFLYCPDHPYLPPIEKKDVRLRKYVPSLPIHNRGKSPNGMDVVCFVGIKKFLNCKRRDQIQESVEERYGISLSDGTVTDLGVEFLIRLNCYHNLKSQRVKDDIKMGGGYILGIDGTGDGGSDRLFLAMDLIRDWVLVSERIPSESNENISPIIKDLIKKLSNPLAGVCDNGSGMRSVLFDIIPNISLRSCNYHFLKDVGNPIMEENYTLFRQLMINNGIQAYLKRIRKRLYWEAKKKGIDIKKYAQMVRKKDIPKDVPLNNIIMSETYDCISWVLRYYEDNSGLRFPYALPYLNLYARCKKGCEVITEIRRMASLSMNSPKYLRNIEFTLKNLIKGSDDNTVNLRIVADKLTDTYALFDKLRKILDIPNEKGDIPRDKLIIQSNKRIAEMKERLEKFREELRTISKDENNISEKIIVEYLDKYWDNIILENVVVKVNGEKKVIEIPRTSSGNDTCFGEIKSDIRKRLGKKDTGRELNRYGPYLGIIQNLKKVDYVKTMFGSWEDIPKALSEIPKDIIDKEKKNFHEETKGYDITNNGIRGTHVKIEDIMTGIELVQECIEEVKFKQTFYPPEIYGKKSNGFLTL